MVLLRRIAVLTALLTIGACDNPSSSSRSDLPLEGAAAYFPVSTGYTWVYEITTLDGQSVVLDTVKVTGVEGNLATLRGPYAYESTYRVTRDAVTPISGSGGASDSSNHMIRTPLSVGTQWKSFVNALEIVAVDTTVSTPAGSFSDVVVVETRTCAGYGLMLCKTSYRILTYYAKNVGLVKYEMWNAGGTGYPLVDSRSLVAFSR